ncbi:MAG: hypothetical protein JOY61_01925 [Chloroflexi bacterium]|nr:hypothetical protein [Chloroflexota bacterium]
MARPDPHAADIGHGNETDEHRASGGGAQPTGEPRTQDSAGAGRGVGLSVSTILGALLIAVPLIWGGYYISQAGAAGVGTGFTILVVVVVLACIGFGFVLLRGLFRT